MIKEYGGQLTKVYFPVDNFIINEYWEENKMFIESNDLITVEELCEILMIGRNAAYLLLQEQKIKAFRIGRKWKIPRAAVGEYILEASALDRR